MRPAGTPADASPRDSRRGRDARPCVRGLARMPGPARTMPAWRSMGNVRLLEFCSSILEMMSFSAPCMARGGAPRSSPGSDRPTRHSRHSPLPPGPYRCSATTLPSACLPAPRHPCTGSLPPSCGRGGEVITWASRLPFPRVRHSKSLKTAHIPAAIHRLLRILRLEHPAVGTERAHGEVILQGKGGGGRPTERSVLECGPARCSFATWQCMKRTPVPIPLMGCGQPGAGEQGAGKSPRAQQGDRGYTVARATLSPSQVRSEQQCW